MGAGKFDALASLEPEIEGDAEMEAPPAPGINVLEATCSSLMVSVESQLGCTEMEHGKEQVVDEIQHGDKRILLQGLGSAGKVLNVSEHESIKGGEVAVSEVVVPVRSSLDPKAHVAGHVVEPSKGLVSFNGLGRRASTGVGVANSKSNMRLQVGK
ncbi:hypothetical protein V6N11_013572 [Hibiscus sabdariffa]|uniref:Uncharacterized protein n=2 Tax=Hibiscus sabdariffa TaxID=183260 RepID=A0ABR2B2G3_9ROSI